MIVRSWVRSRWNADTERIAGGSSTIPNRFAVSGSSPARAFKYASATLSTASSLRGLSRGQATMTPTDTTAAIARKAITFRFQWLGGRSAFSGARTKTDGSRLGSSWVPDLDSNSETTVRGREDGPAAARWVPWACGSCQGRSLLVDSIA